MNSKTFTGISVAFLLIASACLAQTALGTPPATAAATATSAPAAVAPAAPNYADAEPLGAAMEGWPYPYPLQRLQFEMQGQLVRMMYMDVAPTGAPNGRVVLLMHGKNFGADYWGSTIRALSAQGYRVIAPDQIGFGKSSKP